MPILRTAGAQQSYDVMIVKYHIVMGTSKRKAEGLPWWSSGWVHLPVQETRVQSLIQEDPMCCRSAKPVLHSHWTLVLQLPKPTRLEPVLCDKSSHCNEKPVNEEEPRCNEEEPPLHQAQLEKTHNEDTAEPKKKIKINKIQRAKEKNGWQSLETTEG